LDSDVIPAVRSAEELRRDHSPGVAA
jgi:hypothetical protein